MNSVSSKIQLLKKSQLIDMIRAYNDEVSIKTSNMTRDALQNILISYNKKVKINGKHFYEEMKKLPSRGRSERDDVLLERKSKRIVKSNVSETVRISELLKQIKALQKKLPKSSGVVLKKILMNIEKLEKKVSKLLGNPSPETFGIKSFKGKNKVKSSHVVLDEPLGFDRGAMINPNYVMLKPNRKKIRILKNERYGII